MGKRKIMQDEREIYLKGISVDPMCAASFDDDINYCVSNVIIPYLLYRLSTYLRFNNYSQIELSCKKDFILIDLSIEKFKLDYFPLV